MQKFQQNDSCVKELADLLRTDQPAAAFAILDQHIMDIGLDTDHHLVDLFVTISAHYHRAERAFRLGTLPWDEYNLANSHVIQRTLVLARSICAFREQQLQVAEVSTNQDIAITELLPQPHSDILEKTDILTKRELVRANIIKLLEEIASIQQRR